MLEYNKSVFPKSEKQEKNVVQTNVIVKTFSEMLWTRSSGFGAGEWRPGKSWIYREVSSTGRLGTVKR